VISTRWLLRSKKVTPNCRSSLGQVDTIIRSALHQADERAVAEVAVRLARAEGCTRRLDAMVFTGLTGDGPAQDDATAQDDEDDVESVLADIKAHPGNVSLNSLLDEISTGHQRLAGQSIGVLSQPPAPLRPRSAARPARRPALPAAAGDH
jgi:hypothetical protein